jgi:2,5-diketo-D-gluconate reductase A
MDHPNVNRRHHLEQLAGLIAAASATSLLVPLTSARAAASRSHMLRWLVQSGVVVIPKSVRRERMAQNFEVFDFKLDPGEMKAIEKLDTGASLFLDHRDPAIVKWLGELRLAG